MDRWVTPPKRVTAPIWGTLPPCKQTLSICTVSISCILNVILAGHFSGFLRFGLKGRVLYDWVRVRVRN